MGIKERLIRKSESMPNGCIEWRGSYLWDGYGQVGWKYKKYRVHRLSYELFIGPIPDGHVIRHKCDNPKCINPKHLITGTVSQNNRDCKERGRNAKGVSHGASKLTEFQVMEIYNSKASNIKLAKMYGVSEMTTGRIKRGELWGHVTQRWGETNKRKQVA
ncbi:HNH endonuclease signature motif containing protein [Serratia nematodiphila]|uniref:HNH endonuclease signature motif containing protein n=1 Tax=Serratia nematodiphila TaxID=458197 RepID=UPI00164F9536|nr:HNH endonuclease signature motif containing protein [Serratia nematodiphila]